MRPMAVSSAPSRSSSSRRSLVSMVMPTDNSGKACLSAMMAFVSKVGDGAMMVPIESRPEEPSCSSAKSRVIDSIEPRMPRK